MSDRLTTGIEELDRMLGGGLLPGKMTVVMGATGVGKTQLGLSFVQQGLAEEGEPGIIFDMATRGDSQNHHDYVQRLYNRELSEMSTMLNVDPATVWNREVSRNDLLHLFRRSGRRVTRDDLDTDDLREWKIEMMKKLSFAIYFIYGNLIHGARRCLIDGVEPTEKASNSFQFDMIDYIYHQILHKESDWVARDLFRERFREQHARVEQYNYNHKDVGCLLLYTSHEVLLDDLLVRPIESGDILSNANTIILMGKTREGSRMGRALQIAKHRGSACDDSIVPFEITDSGLQI